MHVSTINILRCAAVKKSVKSCLTQNLSDLLDRGTPILVFFFFFFFTTFCFANGILFAFSKTTLLGNKAALGPMWILQEFEERTIFFLFLKRYLFIYLIALCLSCHMWVLCRFSCSKACGILSPPPGMEPASPPLQGEFLTTGPPGKSWENFSYTNVDL